MFEGVLNWAEADATARAPKLALKDVLRGVRFKYMTPEALSKAFWRLSCIVGVAKIDPNVQAIMAAAQGTSTTDGSQLQPAATKGTADIQAVLGRPPRPYYSHWHRVAAVGGCLEPSWEVGSAQPVSSQMLMWVSTPPPSHLALEGRGLGPGAGDGAGGGDVQLAAAIGSGIGGWVKGPSLGTARKFSGCACLMGEWLCVAGGQVSWSYTQMKTYGVRVFCVRVRVDGIHAWYSFGYRTACY